MIKYHTDDKTNQKSEIELFAQNKKSPIFFYLMLAVREWLQQWFAS